MNQYYPHIFEPLRIGNVVFRNRIWSAPAGTHLLQGSESYPNEKSLAYYVNKARGGCAIITYSAQNMDLEKEYDHVHANENILKKESQRFFGEFTSAIHAQGAKVSLELLAFEYHHVLESGENVVLSLNGEEGTQAFTKEDLERIAKSYGDVAEVALKCGFDMLLIHGGHGLCLSKFYSKVLNHRTDEFAADTLENKMRFADMILDEIRSRVGNQLLIEYRISGEEDPKNHVGYTIDECKEMIQHIQDRIDIIHVSTGYFYNGTENITHPTEFLPHGCNVKYAEEIKKDSNIHIPVLTLGGIQKAEEAEEILANEKADIVCMARGLISDASRVEKWKSGKEDEAIPCIRCFHCLDYSRAPYFSCSVNPTVGREFLLPLIHSDTTAPKKVVVIGGGPSGMQACITARKRGHTVILIEKEKELGGKLVFSKQVSFKQDLRDFMNYQIHMIEKLGVEVHTNTIATKELLEELKADAVIAAVGAEANIPNIPGVSNKNVITAEKAYQLAECGDILNKKVVILGGGLVGCETGLYLAKSTHCDVSIIEMLPEVAKEEMYLTRDALFDELKEHTTIHTASTCIEILEHGIVYENKEGQHTIDCDFVVLSAGMKPRIDLAESFRDSAVFFESIGDCVKAENVRNATRSGYDAASRI